MYNDTITLFNRYESRLGDTWYPTVLHGVNLNIDKASIAAKYGVEAKDNVLLNVRYKSADRKQMIGEKVYLTPKEWRKQSADVLPWSLTFADGQSFDFIYVGDWGSEDPISEANYDADNGFYSYMNKNYDNVFAITSVGFYSVIPHLEILAK